MDDHRAGGAAVTSFSRPRYFYGQLLDVRHFESEQEYFKRKLWLLNRLVSGCGVVCGLDVEAGDDYHSIVVTSGLALDCCGREIVVPYRSKAIPIESMPPGESDGKEQSYKDDPAHCDDDWVHLVICYQECRTDPEPVLTGGCDEDDRCSPGAVREGYELRLQPGKAPEVSVDSSIPNLIKGNYINYRALVDWVSAPCKDCGDTCITLANIRRPTGDGRVESTNIDIAVRPIVYTLDLLWELITALSHETQNRRSGKH